MGAWDAQAAQRILHDSIRHSFYKVCNGVGWCTRDAMDIIVGCVDEFQIRNKTLSDAHERNLHS